MGRDKPKDYKRMNYHQKRGYLKGQAQKYGISERDYQDDEGNHKDRLDSFLGSSQSMEDAVVKAMNADYDMRESLKYGKDSGNKHFKDTTYGVSNINEAVNAHRAIQKYGKKDLKQKNTSSANDYADISHNLFNESRDKFSDDIKADFDDEQTDAAIKPDDNEVPYEESQQSKDAKATLDKWKAGLGPGGNISPYGPSSPSAPNVPSPYGSESSTPVTTNVDEFVDGYKKDVKAAYNFQPTLG